MNFSKPIAHGFSGNGSDFKKINPKKKRVGRGTGSGTGKTSARGSNGQNSRSGCALRNFEGGQKTITSLPRRGFVSTKPKNERDFQIVHLSDIEYRIKEGTMENVNPIDKNVLLKAGFFKTLNKKIKLLFDVDIDIALNIKLDAYSKNAILAIEKTGGKCL